MGNVIEKITLYDILGYLFPGCILGFMTVVGISCKYGDVFEKCHEAYGGGLYFAFLVVSYLMGIVISEISELFLGKPVRWMKSKMSEKRKGNEVQKREFRKGKDEMDAAGITAEELAAALYNSGKTSSINKIVRSIKTEGWKTYTQYMYGAIQSNEKYKRIHNYASMKVLCKNMAMALFVGMAILCYFGFRSRLFMVAVTVSIAALLLRYMRFARKTDEYTIVWFVNQFCSKEEAPKQGK